MSDGYYRDSQLLKVPRISDCWIFQTKQDTYTTPSKARNITGRGGQNVRAGRRGGVLLNSDMASWNCSHYNCPHETLTRLNPLTFPPAGKERITRQVTRGPLGDWKSVCEATMDTRRPVSLQRLIAGQWPHWEGAISSVVKSQVICSCFCR